MPHTVIVHLLGAGGHTAVNQLHGALRQKGLDASTIREPWMGDACAVGSHLQEKPAPMRFLFEQAIEAKMASREGIQVVLSTKAPLAEARHRREALGEMDIPENLVLALQDLWDPEAHLIVVLPPVHYSYAGKPMVEATLPWAELLTHQGVPFIAIERVDAEAIEGLANAVMQRLPVLA